MADLLQACVADALPDLAGRVGSHGHGGLHPWREVGGIAVGEVRHKEAHLPELALLISDTVEIFGVVEGELEGGLVVEEPQLAHNGPVGHGVLQRRLVLVRPHRPTCHHIR